MRPRPAPRTEPRPEARAGTITAITAQARDPERVSVFLDGAFAFGLPALVAHDEGLRLGDRLDAARAAALIARDEVARATSAALAFLGYRPRSEQEVRGRLRQKAYTPEAIDQAVAKVAGWGYLDDASFARLWVDGRGGSRGRRLLEQELRQKGVERETAREALDEAALDERAAALEAAASASASSARPTPPLPAAASAVFSSAAATATTRSGPRWRHCSAKATRSRAKTPSASAIPRESGAAGHAAESGHQRPGRSHDGLGNGCRVATCAVPLPKALRGPSCVRPVL
jgi:regulatory protein